MVEIMIKISWTLPMLCSNNFGKFAEMNSLFWKPAKYVIPYHLLTIIKLLSPSSVVNNITDIALVPIYRPTWVSFH